MKSMLKVTCKIGVAVALAFTVGMQSASAYDGDSDPGSCKLYAGYKHQIAMWFDDHIHGVGSPNQPEPGWWEWEVDTVWHGNDNSHTAFVDGEATGHHEIRCPDIH